MVDLTQFLPKMPAPYPTTFDTGPRGTGPGGMYVAPPPQPAYVPTAGPGMGGMPPSLAALPARPGSVASVPNVVPAVTNAAGSSITMRVIRTGLLNSRRRSRRMSWRRRRS